MNTELIIENIDAKLLEKLEQGATKKGVDLSSYALYLLKISIENEKTDANAYNLENGYKEMANDSEREKEAFDWIEGNVNLFNDEV